MATKRYTPLDDPPSASSDDDETEDEQEIITQNTIHQSSSSSSEDEEEEEDDDEEEEETPTPTKNPQFQNPQIKNPQFQNPPSNPPQLSSESESESDSDSKIPMGIPKASIFEFDYDVRSPTASDFAIKPSKKIESFDVFETTPTSKRRRLTNNNNNKKKIKVLNGDVDEEKKAVVKRVWTVEDELMLLQGFIDYQSKIGCSPLSDMDGFYQFTMSSLPGYATKSQLYEKVRRLKKKFRVNSEKVSGNGEEAVFIKPHERTLFELSNKIWGVDGCENVGGNGGGSTAKGKVRVTKVKPKVELKVEPKVAVIEKEADDEQVVKVEDFETLYPFWNAGLTTEVSTALKFPDGVVKLVKENLSLIGEAKAKEMNEKWEAIFENEAVLRKRRIALLSNVSDVETA
ncbi:putative transcription factor GeBP family [Helianthus annuus]|nr:putative transcription factor GeBP family [Helianthus annuus]